MVSFIHYWVRHAYVHAQAREGKAAGRAAEKIFAQLDHYLSACQLGITENERRRRATSESAQIREGLPHDADEILHVRDRLVHELALVAVEFDLDHPLHAALAEHARHADEVALALLAPARSASR